MSSDNDFQVLLGTASEEKLLRRVLANSGYEYSGPRAMRGLSGLEYDLDAVGLRPNNIALVVSASIRKDLGLRPADRKWGDYLSPRFQTEVWARDVLLRLYDISAVLEHQGVKVDLVLFENRFTKQIPPEFLRDLNDRDPFKGWVEQYNVPRDLTYHLYHSLDEIDRPGPRYMSDTLNSAGACYFSLDDFSLPEIGAICGDDETKALAATHEAMSRLRLDQYFNPPTDELLLTALSLSPRTDSAIIKDIYDVAVSLAHTPVSNVIVPQTDYSDPVATARQLANIGAIEYSAEVRLQENGRHIVHRVAKTAQENFVIRVLRTLNISGIAEALIKGLKGSVTGKP